MPELVCYIPLSSEWILDRKQTLFLIYVKLIFMSKPDNLCLVLVDCEHKNRLGSKLRHLNGSRCCISVQLSIHFFFCLLWILSPAVP